MRFPVKFRPLPLVITGGWVLATSFSSPPIRATSTPIQDPTPRANAPGSTRPRSVLFYLIDTCRADRIGFNGYQRMTTPFLKWMAKRSVVFESCFSQAPWTKPSMASMLSSRYPSQTGIYKMMDRLPEEVVTWPEVLHDNGLYTAGFSANIVMGNLLSNYAQGFDHFVESSRVNQGDPIRFASGSSKKLNDFVFPWLERSDHWPMLLYVHSVDPHEEYEPEPSYLAKFADPQRHPRFREEWRKLLQSRPPIPGLYVTQDNFDRTKIDRASFIEHGSNLYDADLLANDNQMERLWNEVQEDGWGEDCIFVFTSDHGEEFFEHGGTSHGYSLYDEMIRVPLMIYAPGLLPAGKRVHTPVRSLDIFPTLCELLGFEIPESVQGESLVALARGAEPSEERPILSEHREDPGARQIGQGSGELVSLRAGPWKFILNQKSSQLIAKPRFELFDLESDPGEQQNVAEQYPELVRRFEVEVASFIAEKREGAAVEDWVTADPDVLEQLRRLGYLSEEDVAEMLERSGEDSESAGASALDLWTAVKSGDLETCERFLESGVDTNQLDDTLGTTPLSWAAMRGDLEIAEALLDAGAAIDARNKDGATALIGAAFFGRAELVDLLLERGADPAIRNADGTTALLAARATWDVTEFIAQHLGIEIDRTQVEEGREQCAEILAGEAGAMVRR